MHWNGTYTRSTCIHGAGKSLKSSTTALLACSGCMSPPVQFSDCRWPIKRSFMPSTDKLSGFQHPLMSPDESGRGMAGSLQCS